MTSNHLDPCMHIWESSDGVPTMCPDCVIAKLAEQTARADRAEAATRDAELRARRTDARRLALMTERDVAVGATRKAEAERDEARAIALQAESESEARALARAWGDGIDGGTYGRAAMAKDRILGRGVN